MPPLLAFARLVKFEHTVFALPFALLGFLLAAEGRLPLRELAWVLAAMVSARSAAMAFNRLADLKYDRENPRTRKWPLVSGEATVRSAWIFFSAASLLFFVSAASLNRLTLALSPAAFLLVTGYSFTKRFTWTCHFWLGLALACAPVGGWLAVRPEPAAAPLLLAAAVCAWVAGFDILYACPDLPFDHAHGLHSVPARFGIAASLRAARCLHAVAAALLAALPLAAPVGGPLYWAGWGLFAGMLAWEHTLVRADDLSRVGAAFFTANGLASVAYFALAALALHSIQ